MKNKITSLILFLMVTAFVNAQAPLYSNVSVSDGGFNSLVSANSSRNVAVDNSGNIYAVYTGSNGIRVAKSTNRGQGFLPSVQVSTDNSECEIAISSNGTIHVAWSDNSSNLVIASSTNGGVSFSVPNLIGGFGSSPHIATYGAMVYVLPQSSSAIYANSTNGIGVFTSTSIGGYVFSDVFTDSTNGDVFVLADNPTVFMFKSTNNAASFSSITLSPAIAIFYSSYALSIGSLGKFIFVSGSGSDCYKIDLSTGLTTYIPVQNNNINAQGRTLIADEFGNFVDGYNNGGSLDFRISYNQGTTWQAPVSVANGDSHNIARNQVYQDVVVVYSSGGQIYCTVYGAALPGGVVNSFIVGQNCGATISNLSVTIKTPPVTGTSTYRFRLTNTVTNGVQIIDRPVNSFALTNVAGITLGTQYQIEVSTDLGLTYGAPCMVKTPTPTATIGAQCGTTLTTMNQWVYATYQSSVTGYRFKVTNTVTSDVQVYDPLSGQNRFNFNQLTPAMRAFGTTYTVEVALRNTDGTYLPYGSGCAISTPMFPTSEVVLSQCDYTAVSNTQSISALVVAGATNYRFELTNAALSYAFFVDRPVNTFNLNMFPGLTSGTTYTVHVAVRIDGVWGPLTGKACNLTTPGIIVIATKVSVENSTFSAIAYPNPFAENFKFDVQSATSTTIQVRVYDMFGRQIENSTVAASEINNLQFGAAYPSGVYNVIVTQGENTQNVRVIKR